jgi:hypothetical protein
MANRAQKPLTERLQKDICDLIRLGLSPREAAASNGVPNEDYGTWMAMGTRGGTGTGKYMDFKLAVEQAEAACEALLVGRVMAAANDGNWGAASFLLERRFPGRWTRKSVTEDPRLPNTDRPAKRGTDDPFEALDNVESIEKRRKPAGAEDGA